MVEWQLWVESCTLTYDNNRSPCCSIPEMAFSHIDLLGKLAYLC